MSEELTVQPEQAIETLQLFNDTFKNIRKEIEAMTDDQLIETYEKARQIANVSWLIRVLVLGTAKGRAVRGDGVLRSLAQAFDIGVRMAQLDVAVYEAFVRDNPEFEPTLPAIFYQIAVGTGNPKESIELAVQMRAENPGVPASAFKRLVDGKAPKEPHEGGLYIMIKCDAELTLTDFVEEASADGEGITELYGRTKLYSIAGKLYAEITR